MKEMKEMRESSKGNTRILYHLDYWDGPISGVCLYEGKKCYFDTVEEVEEKIPLTDRQWEIYLQEMMEYDPDHKFCEDERWEWNSYRIYAIYETPIDVIKILDEEHDLFKKYVGLHTDYDESGKRGCILRDSKEHSKFYGNKKNLKIEVENWKILDKFVSPF